MDKNKGKNVFPKEKNNFDGELTPLEQLFNLAVFLPLLILSVIISVVSFQIGIFTELNTKSTLLILGFRFLLALAIPLGWTGFVSLIIKFMTRPSPMRRYILESIAHRLEIAIDGTADKFDKWFDNNLSTVLADWLKNRNEKKRLRLEKWKEWSECQNISYQAKNPLPVSLFDENDED